MSRRTIEINAETWVFKQAGGCIEIGQQDDGSQNDLDLIHLCERDDVLALIGALKDMLGDRDGTLAR